MLSLELVADSVWWLLMAAGIGTFAYHLRDRRTAARLEPSAFKRGWMLVDFAENITALSADPGHGATFTTETGQFRFVTPSKCIFFPNRDQKPILPLKGTLVVSQSNVRVEARAPVGTVLLVSLYALSLITQPPLAYALGERSLTFVVTFTATGALFMFVVAMAALSSAVSRTHTIAAEIQARLESRAA